MGFRGLPLFGEPSADKTPKCELAVYTVKSLKHLKTKASPLLLDMIAMFIVLVIAFCVVMILTVALVVIVLLIIIVCIIIAMLIVLMTMGVSCPYFS